MCAENGDAALLRLSQRFDGIEAERGRDLELDGADLDAALNGLPPADRAALETAAERIRSYHERQPTGAFEYEDELGNRLGQRATPLDRVGVYVPGGQAAYPSTVLMTAIPAKVAGVGEVIALAPTPNGVRNPHVLAAMRLAGVDRAFTVGGAQAIAALAYGTATVPRVDKIVGPGGAFVAAAKRLVFGPVGIDSIAGPQRSAHHRRRQRRSAVDGFGFILPGRARCGRAGPSAVPGTRLSGRRAGADGGVCCRACRAPTSSAVRSARAAR